MPFNQQNLPRRFTLNPKFNEFREHEMDYFFRAEKERKHNLGWQGAINMWEDIFGTGSVLPSTPSLPDVRPELLKDPESYSTEPKRIDQYGEMGRSLAEAGGMSPTAQLAADWAGSAYGLAEASDTFLQLGALDGWSGWVGNDTAGYAIRRGIAVDGPMDTPYANIPSTGTARPVDENTEERFNAFYLGDVYDKFKQLFDNVGAMGNLIGDGSPYQDITDSLNYTETDQKYISQVDGSFNGKQYFFDTYGKNQRLLSVLDRNGFSLAQLAVPKNKRSVDYLIGRAVTRSTLESTLESYYENSVGNQWSMMAASLLPMIYNDPDLPATLGIGVVTGSAKSLVKGIAKGVIKSSIKGTGKSVVKYGIRATTREAADEVAKQTFRKALGSRVANLFHRAGKASAFSRYAAAGFRVEQPGFRQIADGFLKLGVAGAAQGFASDVMSQRAMLKEAEILGATTDREEQFDYTRLAMATSLGFVLGGALGSIPAITRAMKKAKNKTNQQVTSTLTMVDEASVASGERYASGRPMGEDANANRAANDYEARDRARRSGDRQQTTTEDGPDVKLDRMTDEAVARKDNETGRFALMDAEKESGVTFSATVRTKDATKAKKLAAALERIIRTIENKVKKSGKKLTEEEQAFVNNLKRQENMFRRRLGLKDKEIPSTESVKTTEKRQGARKAFAPLNEAEKTKVDEKTKTKKTKRKSKMSRKQRKKASRGMRDDKFFRSLSPDHSKFLDVLNTLVDQGILKMDAALALRAILSNESPRYLRNIRYRKETGDFIVTRPGDETGQFSRSSDELAEDLIGTYAEVESRGEDGSVELILNLEEIKKASSVEQIGVLLHEIAGHIFHEDLPIHLQRAILDEYNNMTPADIDMFKSLLKSLGADERQVSHAMSNPHEFFAELTRMVLTDRYDRAGIFDEAHNLMTGMDPAKQYRILDLLDQIYTHVAEKAMTVLKTIMDIIRGTQEELDGSYRNLTEKQEEFLQMLDGFRSRIEESYADTIELDSYMALSGTVIKNKLKRALTDYPLSKAIRDEIEAGSLKGRSQGITRRRPIREGDKDFLESKQNITSDVFIDTMFYLNDFLTPSKQNELFLDNKTDIETFKNSINLKISMLDQSTQAGRDLATYFEVRYLDPFEMFGYTLYVDGKGNATKLGDLISQAAQIRSVIDPLRIDSEMIQASMIEKGNSVENNVQILEETNFDRRAVGKGLNIAFENSINLGLDVKGHPLTDMLDYGDFVDGTLSNAIFLNERIRDTTGTNLTVGIMSEVPSQFTEAARHYLHIRDRLARIERGSDIDLRTNANFKEWFGDSKASYTDGTAMLMFHGTRALDDFDSFNPNITTTDAGFFGKGFYFTPSAGEVAPYAGGQGGRIIPVYISMSKPFVSDGYFFNAIKPLFEKHPDLAITSKEYDSATELYEFGLTDRQKADAEAVAQKIQDLLKREGYDGVIVKDGQEYVVFDAEQVKSAISNDGSYDKSNPDIKKALAPENRENTVPPPVDMEAAARIQKFNELRTKKSTLFTPESGLKLAEGHEDIASLPASKLEEMVLNGSIVVEGGKLKTKTMTILQAAKQMAQEQTLDVIESTTPAKAKEAVSDSVISTAKNVTKKLTQANDKSILRKTASTQKKLKRLPDELVIKEDGSIDVQAFVGHLDSNNNPSVYDALIKSINGVLRNQQDAEDAAGEIIADVMNGLIVPDPEQTTSPTKLLNFLAGKGVSKGRDSFREQNLQFTEGKETKFRKSSLDIKNDEGQKGATRQESRELTEEEKKRIKERQEKVSKEIDTAITKMENQGILTPKEAFVLKREFGLQRLGSMISDSVKKRSDFNKALLKDGKSMKEPQNWTEEQTQINAEIEETYKPIREKLILNKSGKPKQDSVVEKELKKLFPDEEPETLSVTVEKSFEKFREEGTIDIDGLIKELNFESTSETFYNFEAAQGQIQSDALQEKIGTIDTNAKETEAAEAESEVSTSVTKVTEIQEKEARKTTVSSNDSKTDVINTKSAKTVTTGEPTVFTVHEVSTKSSSSPKTKMASTSKPKAEAVRSSADQTKETVIQTSTVSPKKPAVVDKPIKSADDVVDQIPDDLLIVDGVDPFILKMTLKNALETMRKLGMVKTMQDQYDFIMTHLKEKHGIDAVIHVDGDEATLLLPADLPRQNVVNETHSATGKVEVDGVKVDEDAAVPDADGNTKPIDDQDEHVIENGLSVAEGTRVEDAEPHMHDTENMSVQDQVDSFILSDNAYLQAMGADLQLVSRLIAMYPETMRSFQEVSNLVGGYLLESTAIMRANIENHGYDSFTYFWKQVETIRKNNDKKQQKNQASGLMGDAMFVDFHTILTEKQIYELAAAKTNKRFNKKGDKPRFQEPLQPEEYDITVGSRRFKEESEKIKTDPEAEDVKFDGKAKGAIRKYFNKKDGNNSRIVREQGWVGTIFGGSDESSQNLWRRTMTQTMLFSQMGAGLKDTMYSYVPVVQKLSRLVDDTRFQTGHIVAAGKRPIKTWMASDSASKRFLGILMTENSRMMKTAKKYKSAAESMTLIFDARATKTPLDKDKVKELLLEKGVNSEKLDASVDELFNALVRYNKTLTLMFKKVFDLQEETGWTDFISGYTKEKPFDPETYVPVTLDPNKIAGHSDAIEVMTSARRDTIKNKTNLHTPIFYALGWLPTNLKEGDIASPLFSKGVDHQGKPISDVREALERVIESDFDSETITKNTVIRTRTNPLESTEANSKLHGRLGRDWFVVKDGDDYIIVRMPKSVDDLSASDKAKYMSAVDGDTSNYTPSMLDLLKTTKNKDIIMVEMAELLSYKLGQGIYGNSVISGKNYSAILGLGDPTSRSVAVKIQNITPEEVAKFPQLKEILQTNTTLSTLDFLNGRLFELLAQRELDRMLGTKGIRMYEFLRQMRALGQEAVVKSQESPDTQAIIKNSLNQGINKIEEMYSMYSGTLSRIDDGYTPMNDQLYALSSNLVQGSTAWGYGTAALVETLVITTSSGINPVNPIRIINNATVLLRNALGDLRYDNAADVEAVRDTIFAFEVLNRNNSVRFLSEMDEGIELTNSTMENWFGPEGAGLPDSVSNSAPAIRLPQQGLAKFAYFANQVGSLQQVTNANRMLASVKHKAKLHKLIASGRLIKFLDKIEEPETAKKIKNLESKTSTDRKAQAELIKYVKSIAREEGLKYQDIVPFLQYGLLSRDFLQALSAGLKAIEAKAGRFDFAKLRDLYTDIRSNKRKLTDDDGLVVIDPDTLEEAVDIFVYMVEQLTTLRDVSEPMGFSKRTGKASRTWLGRLFEKLFNWVSSYQYGTISNYGGRTTLKYIVGTLVGYAVADLTIRTFREWLAGRDAEDILKEVENEPIRYISKAAAGVPLLGRFNGFLGLIVNSVQTALGTEPTHTFNPIGAPGLEALPKFVDKGTQAIKTTGELITGQSDKNFAEISADYAKLAMLDGPINKSPLGIPVRIFEETGAITEGSSTKEFLDGIQRDARPYQRRKNRRKTQKYDFSPREEGLSLLEQQRMQKQQRDNIENYNNSEKLTQLERVRKDVEALLAQSGESLEKPLTPRRTEDTPKSSGLGSGPSKASQSLADVLQKKQKK